MGAFDSLKCKYPLPIEGANELDFQTKSMWNSFDNYELKEDGTLWVERYDTEDRSDPKTTGIERLAGIATRVNQRWIQENSFTGEVRFHSALPVDGRFIEFSSYFVNGQLKHLEDASEPAAQPS